MVCAVGIRPQARLARDAGLVVDRGIVVDDGLATSDPNIFALGECAEHRGIVYGLVEPAYEQAKILARRLAGETSRDLRGLDARDQSEGLRRQSVFGRRIHGRRVRAMSSPSRMKALASTRSSSSRTEGSPGAVLFGDTADGLWYLDLIRSGADISHMRDMLAFGPALALPQAA